MQTDTVKVWDPLVRIFHWTLVLAFFTAYLTEDGWLDLHTLAGYTVLGLVAFRLLWGLVGSRHARFSDFVVRPRTVLAYLKDVLSLHPRRYLGHNPAGGMMIVLLLASLLATTGFGLAVYAAEEGAGPLALWLSDASEGTEHLVEEVHEFFANLTLFLVAVHVAGVIVESLLHGENLVRAMVSGRKPAR
ncbi:MAG TPA: cytochrome b/b6 domain-containing protein [Thiohalobacter sp.]|nr:cytochrome b/b6 domain-containing protein [Thiohalobacter sp.]